MKKVKILIKTAKEDIEYAGFYNAKTSFDYVEKLKSDERFIKMLNGKGYSEFKLNIKKLYGHGGFHSTVNPKQRMGIQENSDGSAIIGQIKPGESEASIELDGTSYEVVLDVIPYGIVIGTGKVCTNFLGGRFTGYIKKFTSRNVVLNPKGDARCFKSENEAVKFVQKHYNALCYLVENYEYELNAEFASEDFERDWEKKHSGLPILNEILQGINDKQKDYEWKIKIEGTEEDDIATEQEMEEEAIDRLCRLLHVSYDNAKEKLMKDIMMSYEGREVLLDDGAKRALKELKNTCSNYKPYYIIKTFAWFGTLYSVLFVSPYKYDWKMERPDGINILLAYVYNDTDEFNSEFGSIKVNCQHRVLNRIDQDL